jgi:hypothetical protein
VLEEYPYSMKMTTNRVKRNNRLTPEFRLVGVVAALLTQVAANDANAQALSTGCHNADFVRATLQREGQFAVINGVRPIPERPRNMFTTNGSGSLGYNIEQGTGDVTGKLCVRARYTDIQLNGNINGPTPRWALIGQNTAHNRWLETQRTTTDERVLLGARVLRSENGQDVRGGFMMVTRGSADNAQTINNAGAITISFDNGEIRPTILLGNVEPVQPNYDGFARTRATQVAKPSGQ